MTDMQKKRIGKLRQMGIGYAAIAKELKLPVGTVKTFCRRNGLQADDLASDTQLENKSEQLSNIDLLSAENRGNTVTAKRPRSLENSGVLGDQPVCGVTVSYADEPDAGAVADVLDLLTNAHYGEVTR